MLDLEREPSPRDLLVFRSLLVVFAVGLVLWRRGDWRPEFVWSLGAVLFGLAAVSQTVPSWRVRIYTGWMQAVAPIAWIVSTTLLAVVYFGVVLPIGVLRRRFGGDPLQRAFNRSADTYWESCQPRDSHSYFTQF